MANCRTTKIRFHGHSHSCLRAVFQVLSMALWTDFMSANQAHWAGDRLAVQIGKTEQLWHGDWPFTRFNATDLRTGGLLADMPTFACKSQAAADLFEGYEHNRSSR